MPSHCRSIAQSSRLAVLSLGLASCTSQRPSSDLDDPIFGSARTTAFIIAPKTGPLHSRDLTAIARVLRRYKTLDEAERALVKSAVSHRLSALVALELERLTKQNQPAREALEKIPDKELSALRIAAFDVELRKAAAVHVLQYIGNLIAVPLKTSDNRSPIAFARIRKDGIAVSTDSLEVDQPIEHLIEGVGVRTGSGEVATVLGTEPISVRPSKP